MVTFAFWILVLGGAALLIFAVCCLWVMAVDAFMEWKHEPHQRSFYEGMEHVRNGLRSDSWWFSESLETQQLVMDLASGMSVSDARDKWRKARQVSEDSA